MRTTSLSLLLLLLATSGCENGGVTEPLTSTLTPAPTRTPLPSADVAGSWHGAFHGYSLGCDGNVKATASANFAQDGSRIRAGISAGCAFNRSFVGTIRGADLSLSSDDTMRMSIVGSVNGGRITAKVSHLFVSGQLTLER